jgi:glycosyltransferase involved in cell wall biosynthesis
MQATIVITTKNRKQDLAATVRSALQQTANPEVLVIDDGSTDGTSEMIRAEFPGARLDRSEKSLGYIAQRNRAARLATGDIVFSIDDDAVFSSPRIIEQTLAEFDHPRIGAVAMPFINVNSDRAVHPRAAENPGILCGHEFIGTAHAVRRELFVGLGGYREYLFHQGEENDYCIRMLDAGYVVRLGQADPIHHFESPRRDLRRMDYYGRRNDVLFVWYNVPWRNFPVYMLGTSVIGMRLGFRIGRPWRMAVGLAGGYISILHELAKRKPVSGRTYQLNQRLKRGPLALEEIENMLAPMREHPALPGRC